TKIWVTVRSPASARGRFNMKAKQQRFNLPLMVSPYSHTPTRESSYGMPRRVKKDAACRFWLARRLKESRSSEIERSKSLKMAKRWPFARKARAKSESAYGICTVAREFGLSPFPKGFPVPF